MPHVHHSHHIHKLRQPGSSILAKAPEKGKRFIEKLRNRHKGKEIWILGTGPSMDDYPDDFFNDKISIGVKAQNIRVFPNSIYHIASIGQKRVRRSLVDDPERLKKLILTMRTQPPCSPDWVPKKYRKYPTFMWDYRINVRRPNQAALIPEAIKRIKRKQCSRYPHDDNIAHLAIQAAAIMGAKKITLVGCEDKGFYADRYKGFYSSNRFAPRVSKERLKKKWKSGVRHRKANRMFAKALKHQGVQLTLFHLKDSKQYKAGYLKLA